MKKALVPTKPQPKPKRLCGIAGCGKPIYSGTQKFCSKEHRIAYARTHLKPENGPKWTLKAAREWFDEYLTDCEAEDRRELIPTESSYIVLSHARPPSREDYIEFLARKHKLHIGTTTLDNWEIAHPEFGYAMERLRRVQKVWLINNGLAGRYNPVVAKLMLSSNHGMVERREVDNRHRMIGVVKMVYDKADEEERHRRQGIRSPDGFEI